jgi:hypothetical protein
LCYDKVLEILVFLHNMKKSYSARSGEHDTTDMAIVDLPGAANVRGYVVTEGIVLAEAVDDAHRTGVNATERAGVNIGWRRGSIENARCIVVCLSVEL